MLRKIDCLMIYVEDVEAAAAYYAQVFGLRPHWSGDDAIGLVFPESDAEIVLHRDPHLPSPVEAHYLVDDVLAAVTQYTALGCQVLVAPFEITIGKCAVIQDPFGIRLCILDMTKGPRPLNRATAGREEPEETRMNTEQEQWAVRFREIPLTFEHALRASEEHAIRRRPAPGEWSAIEVLGHLIDKMGHWSYRVERIWREDRPTLPGYDQDAEVREHEYQRADPAVLHEHLRQRCERFAVLVASLPSSALQREGVHGEYGPMTLRQCIEAPLASVPEHLAQLRAAQGR